MTKTEQRRAARAFAAKWSGKGYEKGECQEIVAKLFEMYTMLTKKQVSI